MGYFVEEIQRKHRKNIGKRLKSLRKLKAACERAKRELSFMEHTVIQIDSLYNSIDFESKISRAKFEELNMDLFEKCIVQVGKCLKDAEMDKASVHDVVLVGGSSRIPKVQQLLRDFFDGKELCKSIHADEAVALGAAIQAAILSGQCNDSKVKDVSLHDVTPLSLGMGVVAGQMSVVVPRNTTFPAKVEKVFHTSWDDQTSCVLDVYEGERPRARDNIHLGTFTLSGIPRAPRKSQRFVMWFDIDADGILNVSAVIESTGKKCSLTIGNVDTALRPKDEVDRMLEAAERCKRYDGRLKNRFAARKELENYIFDTRDSVLTKRSASSSGKLTTRVTKKIRDEIESSIGWLRANEAADMGVLVKKMEELGRKWDPFLAKYGLQ